MDKLEINEEWLSKKFDSSDQHQIIQLAPNQNAWIVVDWLCVYEGLRRLSKKNEAAAKISLDLYNNHRDPKTAIKNKLSSFKKAKLKLLQQAQELSDITGEFLIHPNEVKLLDQVLSLAEENAAEGFGIGWSEALTKTELTAYTLCSFAYYFNDKDSAEKFLDCIENDFYLELDTNDYALQAFKICKRDFMKLFRLLCSLKIKVDPLVYADTKRDKKLILKAKVFGDSSDTSRRVAERAYKNLKF